MSIRPSRAPSTRVPSSAGFLADSIGRCAMPPDAAADAVVLAVHRRLLADGERDGDLVARAEALARAEAPLLDGASLASIVRRVTSQARGLGVLDPLLADP